MYAYCKMVHFHFCHPTSILLLVHFYGSSCSDVPLDEIHTSSLRASRSDRSLQSTSCILPGDSASTGQQVANGDLCSVDGDCISQRCVTQRDIGMISYNPDTSNHKLGLCRGDCDEHSECEDGLKCFQMTYYDGEEDYYQYSTRFGEDYYLHQQSEGPVPGCKGDASSAGICLHNWTY